MKLFSDMTTNDVIDSRKRAVKDKIDDLTNEEIMANNLGILAENFYQEFFIAPVTIHEEDFERRRISQGKVEKCSVPSLGGRSRRESVKVDGVIAEFHFPFDGDAELFRCKASTFSLNGYPQIDINDGDMVFRVSKSIDEAKHTGKDKLISDIEESLRIIKQGIEYANKDINKFNSELKLFVWKLLNEKKSKVEAYYDFAKMLEIPIEKKDFALTHISVERKILPIAHEYDTEEVYNITDSDYSDILDSIKHTLSTYERTPGSYKSMQEEDLRNTILAALNGIYKGNATGETFRKNGKTDICIEQDNRAAFVAECKMWTGQKEIEEAVHQLDNYLTWRDCKTALIYFVRRKDFIKVLDKAKEALIAMDGMKSVKEIDRNEFDCLYISKSNVGQQIKIRVMLFNLFSEY